ncbi:uncharacterized protein LOC131691340 [Topomyia yanbarensis]|uniref:uncharacterized protein LOC131691340 n=1 Tax=Topomyia yanbarensis TaxID=2498891 RepID=UPI00273CAC74|nr:uncharacterized protein LOC131691340 [Topomyia yanbarensis]
MSIDNLETTSQMNYPDSEEKQPSSEKLEIPTSPTLAVPNTNSTVSESKPSEIEAEPPQSKSQQVTVINDQLFEARPTFDEICSMPPEIDQTDLGIEEGEGNMPIIVSEPPFKKNRRIQVPSKDITRGISSIEPSPKKLPKKKLHDPTPQKIGVLVGIPCQRKLSRDLREDNKQLDMMKHLSLVFLFSRLKNPLKWNATTFEEIRSIGDNIHSSLVMTKFSVNYNSKTYYMALTSTVVKGRINSSDAPPPNFKNALIEQISGFSGLVLKCESKYLITWKVAEGYYLYDPCLDDTSKMMFFNSLKMMKQFIIETKQLTDLSKFYMSKVSLSSVDDGHIVTLKRKSRKAKKFEVLNKQEALLMGNKYLKEISYKLESFRISLNAVDLAQQLETRSWDADVLSKLFEGELTDKAINKLGVFLCEEGTEKSFLLDKSRLIRLETAFRYTEREEFERLINRYLAIRVALILKVEEAFVAIWSSQNIVYWFCPFRYDALELDPADLEDKACFLYAFSSLTRLSRVMFDYFIELGLLPRHSIRLFTVDSEPFGKSPRIPMVDSSDSLNRSEFDIRIAENVRRRVFVSDENLPVMTLSEAKLCRIMMREILQEAEKRSDE